MKKTRAVWNRYAFFGAWALGTFGMGWQVLRGQHLFDSPATVPALLVLLTCTITLLWWLNAPALDLPTHTSQTRPGKLTLLIFLTIGVLFPLRTLIGPPLLFGLPVLGLVVLLIYRPQLGQAEVLYALCLALVAGVAGLGAGWVTISPLIWASLQVALVLAGLLAGWTLLRHTRLLQAGIGRNLLLAEGTIPALRGFAQGVVIAMPWALGLVVLGAASDEGWVNHWWQPLTAIQPSIAEEAWGRVLLIPLPFLVFQRVARTRTSLTASVFVMAYWFDYLHTDGGIEGIISTAMIGTLFALPTSYLWLRRGLETAIGFHFWLDFVKFVIAYFLNRGI